MAALISTLMLAWTIYPPRVVMRHHRALVRNDQNSFCYASESG